MSINFLTTIGINVIFNLMKRTIPLFLIALVGSSCIENKLEFEKILHTEDNRMACENLLGYLENSEPRIRARAAEALGKLQDPQCLTALTGLLNDLNHNVRLEAAFALG